MALSTSRIKTQLTPAQQYEALANWVLNKRLWTLSVYTGVYVMGTTALLAMFTGNIFSFSAIIGIPGFSALMCASFLLPLVLIRRWDMQPISTPPTSPSTVLSSLLKSSMAYRTIGVTSLSFASFALLNALCANFLGVSGWALFNPTKRHGVNLNENILFLMLGNALVGAILSFMDLARGRATVKWPNRVTLQAHALFNQATLSFKIIRPLQAAIITVLAFAVEYWWFRKDFYKNVMRLPLLGGIFKPFIFQAARPSTSLQISTYLFWRLLVLSIVSALHYENVQAWFDGVSSLGMLLSSNSPDPDACLRSGIESPNAYYQHLAFMELAHIARKGPSERRAAVYNEQGKWGFISKSCFKTLGEDYGHLKRRGKPLPPPPVPAPAPATPAPAVPLATPRKSNVTNLGASIYRPLPPPSPGSVLFKSLLSASSTSPASSSATSGSPAGTVGSPGGDMRSPAKNGAMPTIFVTKPAAEATKPAEAPAPAPVGEGPLALAKRWTGAGVGKLTARVPGLKKGDEPFIVLPGWIRGFKGAMDKEVLQWQTEGILRRRELARLCVQILSGFTVASLKEDAYGTLQQDIPRVLEVLAKMLLALEEYNVELMEAHNSGKETAQAVDAATGVVEPLYHDLHRAVEEILNAFGDRLNVFRLPAQVARRLQVIADSM